MDWVVTAVNEDGRAYVLFPGQPRDRTEAEWKIEVLTAATRMGLKDAAVVHGSYAQAHPAFSEAWERDAQGRIVVNMRRARLIHMTKIRAIRDQRLAATDVDMIRVQESGDVIAKQELAAKRKALRDIPITFRPGNFKTPMELAQAIPDELK